MEIKRIGVLGAGVMGSQLAAHFANAGFETYLYDLSDDLSRGGLEKSRKIKPAAFYHKKFARRVTPLNYEEHLEKLGECQWIVEAIAERLDWKRDLYAKVQQVIKPGTALTSNTSGIALDELTAGLKEEVRKNFFITHFFNPPRYLRLVEIIQGADTDPDIVREISEVISRQLGKGIVNAKDTPNFIANRIGVYGMMLALKFTEQMKLTVEEVDKLTGPVMGRPKSATYRTADIVGLDTLAFVAQTAYEKCTDDLQRELFQIPPILQRLIEAKRLGQKTREGFYKKAGREILSLDFEQFEYTSQKRVRMDGIGVARRFTDKKKAIHALVNNPDIAGQFAWELTIGTLAYAADCIPEISDDIINIDNALKWGFGWDFGPFEVWDAIGVSDSVARMEAEGKSVPKFARDLLDRGEETFYRRSEDARRLYFDFSEKEMLPLTQPEDVIVLEDLKAAGREIMSNWCASLIDLGDGVACLEFHSILQPEFHPIDASILDMAVQSLQWVSGNRFKGLIISHQGTHFCAGANLAMILDLAKAKKFDMLAMVSKSFQDLGQVMKYSPFPVVAAPFSVCLGGGFEIAAPADRVVALSELYCGAVEVGVGLIPGAGGNLRILENVVKSVPVNKAGPFPVVQRAFETVGFAKVSMSAYEAIDLGYFPADMKIVLQKDHLISEAKKEVLKLAEGYTPPEPPEDLILPGEGGRLAIESTIDNFHYAGAISEHDAKIGKKLAYVLTGGDRADGFTPMDEQYLLDLEREVFVSLAAEPKSQERMAFMLKKGKPLRN